MYAAVDIGGTKTLVATFNNKGELTEQIKFPTPQVYDDFLLELAATVAKLSTKEFNAVGVAAPAKIEHKDGILLSASNLAWKNEPLGHDSERLFNCPVRVENDAKVAALSEAKLAGPKYQIVVYITISTGIGIGVCADGKLDSALLDAEAGLMMVESDDKMVHWQSVASGKAIVAKYGKRASELDDPAAWKNISRLIAKGLMSIIAIIQPDIILVGGGVGAHFEKFEHQLKAELKKYESPVVPIPLIRKAKHPEEAVVYGCYELARSISK